MKQGFTLIELLVVTAIAAVISSLLLSALGQMNRGQAVTDNTINVAERIAIFAQQIEKDLVGAFIPTQAEKKEDGKAEEVEVQVPADKDKTPEKQAAKKDEPAEQAGNKKEKKPIEKIFYSTNKDGMLDTLTFITNNPLVVFVAADVGEVKPKAVRVQYTLRPEPETKDSYTLFRQESNELDLAEYKNVRPYELIGGVKKCSVKFIARIEKKQEKKKDEKAQEQEKQKIEYEYKEMTEWVSEQKKEGAKESGKEGEKDKQQEFPRIPYKVEIKLTLWDQQYNKEKDFILVSEIPIDFSKPKKQEKPPKEQPKKDEKKPENGQQPQQQEAVAMRQSISTQEAVVVEKLTNTLSNLSKLFKQL